MSPAATVRSVLHHQHALIKRHPVVAALVVAWMIGVFFIKTLVQGGCVLGVAYPTAIYVGAFAVDFISLARARQPAPFQVRRPSVEAALAVAAGVDRVGRDARAEVRA